MSGEQKFTVVMMCGAVICITILFVLVTIILWPYRIITIIAFGVILVFLLFFATLYCLVDARGKMNEQDLRHKRVRFREELPLAESGVPYYIPQGYQAYPQPLSLYPQQESRQGYYG